MFERILKQIHLTRNMNTIVKYFNNKMLLQFYNNIMCDNMSYRPHLVVSHGGGYCGGVWSRLALVQLGKKHYIHRRYKLVMRISLRNVLRRHWTECQLQTTTKYEVS